MKKLASLLPSLLAMPILQLTLMGTLAGNAMAEDSNPQAASSQTQKEQLEPDSSNSKDQSTSKASSSLEASSTKNAIQGRIVKAGTLMRLARPSLQSYKSANPNLDSAKKGYDSRYPGSANQEQLKSRVLEAAGMKAMTPMSGARSKYEIYKLSASELRALSRYDICVILDASGSMSRDDCVSINSFILEDKVSRWDWCGEQSELLTQQISNAFPSGITVIPFASTAKRFTNVFPSTINDIFREVGPAGATRLDLALDLEFESFFSDRRFGVKKKPLLIAIISDGVPTAPHLVTRQILDLSKMVRPDEVRIVFFLIGTAQPGAYYINLLSNIRNSDGSKNKLVTSRSFAELCQIGLPRSLALTVQSFEQEE